MSHDEFSVRLDAERNAFRTDLESKILVQWSTKVDALLLYVSNLEEKIRQEQELREKMALLYDQSLAVGYTRLTNETALLSQNPLLHEVTDTVPEAPVNPVFEASLQKMYQLRESRLREMQEENRKQTGRSQQEQAEADDNLNRMTMHYRAQVMREEQLRQEHAAMSEHEQFSEHNARQEGTANLVYPPPSDHLKSMSNHEFSGVAGWFDLEELDCAEAYKNDFETEANFAVTRSSILRLYENQLVQFGANSLSERSVQVLYSMNSGSLKEGHPTIMERFQFTDGADSINHFLKAILAQYKRRQWDRSVVDLRIVKPIISKNMLLMEELSNELIPS